MSTDDRQSLRKSLIRHVSRHVGLFRFSMQGLLAALVLLMVASPFMEMLPNGKYVESALMTAALASAVQAVGNRRTVFWLAFGLVLPAILGQWLDHLRPGLVPPEVFLSCMLLFLLFIIVQLLRFIMRTPRVDAEVLCAGVCTYLMLALLWAMSYVLVGWLDPAAFMFTTGAGKAQAMRGFTSFYFSFITLSTVGYGDIVPVGNVARMLAALEGVTGSLFLGILIARLVSLYSAEEIIKDG